MRDDADFAEFFAAASPRLLKLAWLLTGSAADAEDLVQGALERCYANWSRVEAGGTHAYARRVLINLHRDQLTKRRRERPSDAVPERAVDDRTDQVGQSRVLIDALAGLPQRERQCVILRHHADLTEADVAGLLGVSVGTVKSSTSRGLARLRQSLDHEGVRHV